MQSALRVLLMLQCLAAFSRADVSDQTLQKWVDDSTLVFKGTIVALKSNVSGITADDNPITVKVEQVDSTNAQIKRNFGSLVGEELTVVADPASTSGPERRVGVSAVYFVNPLMYEKHIAVTAHAVTNEQSIEDLSARLGSAAQEKKDQRVTLALSSADCVVIGVVQEIRALPDEKLKKLQLIANGRDLYSEHSPRWRTAVIRVQTVLKGDRRENEILAVIFPSTDDVMWAKVPKFRAGQRGIWSLHGSMPGGMQLSDERAKILLGPEPFQGGELKAYTALRPEDFQARDSDGKNEKRIREMLRRTTQ